MKKRYILSLFSVIMFTTTFLQAELPLSLVHDFNKISVNSDSMPTDYNVFSNNILFLASPITRFNKKLYSYDTSSKKLITIMDVNSPSNLSHSYKTNKGLVFMDDGDPIKLWVTDGTITGTKEIFQFLEPFTYASTFTSKKIGNKVLFMFQVNSEVKIYITDGTSIGTKELDSFVFSNYWKQVSNIDVNNSIVAIFNAGFFYTYDENGNKTKQCSWNKSVNGIAKINNQIYFSNSDDETVYICDLTTKTISDLTKTLTLKKNGKISIVFHNNNSIFFGYSDENNNSKLIKLVNQSLIYDIPFDYFGFILPTLINDHAISVLSGLQIDNQSIDFPGIRADGFLNFQPIPCLEGICIVTSSNSANLQYWYVKFGDASAQLLFSRGTNEDIINNIGSVFGAYSNGKLVLSMRNWDTGLEPGIYDFQDKKLSLIEDLNTNNATKGAGVKLIYNLDNQLFFNVNTVDGRQLWSYEPTGDKAFFIEDEEFNWRDTIPSLRMRNKLYYDAPNYDAPNFTDRSDNGCIAEHKTIIFDLETYKKHFFDCGGLPFEWKSVEEGYIFLTQGYYVHTEPPILYDNAYTFQDLQGLNIYNLSDAQVYENKIYYRIPGEYINFDPKTKNYNEYKIQPKDNVQNYFIGRGQRLLKNGNLFDGAKVIDTGIADQFSSNFDLKVLFYSNGNIILDINRQFYKFDVDALELSTLNWPGEPSTIYKKNLIYSIKDDSNFLYILDKSSKNLYRYDFTLNKYIVFAHINAKFIDKFYFYSNYLYYYESTKAFNRINLNTGKSEILRNSIDLSSINSAIVNDSFGNVFFFANLDSNGSELWKITSPNTIAADHDYVIRHDVENQYDFPVSTDNRTSKFEILSIPKLGSISINKTGFNYIPNIGSAGTDIVSYQFTNSLGRSNIGYLKLFVNQVAVANDDFYGTVGREFNLNPTDNDVDDSKIKNRHINVIQQPEHAIFDSSRLHIIKNDSYVGLDYFTYQIIDEEGDASNIARVDLDFSTTKLNTNPHASDDIYSTKLNESVNLNLLSNDSDKDGDKIDYTLFSDPQNGGLYINKDVLSYKPNKDFVGIDSFDYYVTDNYGQSSNVATVTIKVAVKEPVPTVPVQSGGGTGGGGSIDLLLLYYLLALLFYQGIIRKKILIEFRR